MSHKKHKHRIQHTPSPLSFAEPVPVARAVAPMPVRTAPSRLVKVLTWVGWSLLILIVVLMLAGYSIVLR